MTTNKKQIKGIRILLTLFYGFLLSSTLFRYVIHGTIETIRRPTNPFSITMIVIGGLLLISIFLATYATWYENTVILLVSGGVLICVFILTLVFGIIRIVKTTPHRMVTVTNAPNVLTNIDETINDLKITSETNVQTKQDIYALTEDVTKLIIELIFILFAILATFTLFRYIKAKYASVPTTEK